LGVRPHCSLTQTLPVGLIPDHVAHLRRPAGSNT
jgi:hypothetical protein